MSALALEIVPEHDPQVTDERSERCADINDQEFHTPLL